MRYVLGVFGFIILAIVAVVLISTTTKGRSSSTTEGTPRVQVVDYVNKNATFSLITQGKITGDSEFQSIKISVSPSEARAEILNGYQNTIEKEVVFPNNQVAYDVFVHALANAGYSLERDSANEEIRGSCPIGRRYQYQMTESGNQVLNLWASSCGRKEGNFGGNGTLIQQIFKNQIPDYSNFVSGIYL